jgi:hypothetical protein
MNVIVELWVTSAVPMQAKLAQEIVPAVIGEILETLVREAAEHEGPIQPASLFALGAAWGLSPGGITVLVQEVDRRVSSCSALTAAVRLPFALQDAARLEITAQVQEKLTDYIDREQFGGYKSTIFVGN